jgi:CubicO group peptidase (beta-lactamase class C family)
MRSLAGFVVVALVACGGGARPVGSLKDALDAQLAANAASHGVVGQAVMIYRDGEVIYRGAHGLADRETQRAVTPDDVFPVFSVAKLFVSVLVMQLVERGDVELAKPIGTYLTGLPATWRAVTIAQLMSHQSGLPDYFDPARPKPFPPTVPALIEALATTPMQFAPGAETRYNQVNFILLGALLEQHHGKPYRAIVDERIIKPLGLAHNTLGKRRAPPTRVSHYHGYDGAIRPEPMIDWPDYAITHAELFTTLDDLGAFLQAVRAGRFVKPETWRAHWKGSNTWSVGWEDELEGREHRVGHDGGTVVRVRIVFTDSLANGTYTYLYFTNGSAKNVWSRTLIDSLASIVVRSSS